MASMVGHVGEPKGSGAAAEPLEDKRQPVDSASGPVVGSASSDHAVGGAIAGGESKELAGDVEAGESTDCGSSVGSDSELDEENATHQNFYSWEEVYANTPGVRELLQSFATISEEVRAVGSEWAPWPEFNLYDGADEEWKVLPFLYTFPGNDPSKSVWVENFCQLCPKTVALLRAIPIIRTALVSRMGPSTRLSAHRGWADLANHVLRLHLCLDIPGDPGSHTCGLWVRGEKKYHENGELLCFDDSKLHKAFNNHQTQKRTVLIFDLARPEHLPLGTARKGHTDQLDDFIAWFR